MRTRLLAATAIVALTTIGVNAEEQYPATLEGHAILPAATFIKPPTDAPPSLASAAKYTTPDGHRTDALGTVPGMDGVRPTGISMPFDGQAVQGLSGIKKMADGTFWTLSDNGFGAKLNSPDAALMLHHLRIDWTNGTVERIETVFLTDPDKKVWFPIVHEGTTARYLTGRDFDIESIQPVADGFWIRRRVRPLPDQGRQGRKGARGDRHHRRRQGRSSHPIIRRSPCRPIRPPSSPPSAPHARRASRAWRQSPDGSKLYGLLEGALYKEDGTQEMVDGHPALRILEFDVAKEAWTGRSWLYPLADGGASIGDFNLIDATTGLVIERDNGVGTADKACPDPKQPKPDCFDAPAKLKRIYKIAFDDSNAGGAVQEDRLHRSPEDPGPEEHAASGRRDGYLDFPFVTIENVDVIDADPHHRRQRQQPAVLGRPRFPTRRTTTSSCCSRSAISSRRRPLVNR